MFAEPEFTVGLATSTSTDRPPLLLTSEDHLQNFQNSEWLGKHMTCHKDEDSHSSWICISIDHIFFMLFLLDLPNARIWAGGCYQGAPVIIHLHGSILSGPWCTINLLLRTQVSRKEFQQKHLWPNLEMLGYSFPHIF